MLAAYIEREDSGLVLGKELERDAGNDVPRADGVVGRSSEEHLAARIGGQTSDRSGVAAKRLQALARLDRPGLGERVERAGHDLIAIVNVVLNGGVLGRLGGRVDAYGRQFVAFGRQLLALFELLDHLHALECLLIVGRHEEQRHDVARVAGEQAHLLARVQVPTARSLVV